MPKRVLIVDDEADVRELLGRIVEGAGYEASLCADGASAIERLRIEAYDLVILDVHMPGSNGLATLRKLRHSWPTLKVVILTADLGDETFDTSLDRYHQASGFMNKPFGVDDVRTCLATVLERGGTYIKPQ